MKNERPSKLTESKAQDLLDLMQASMAELTPELRKLACYLLENPKEIGVNSIRKLADLADVKPNTLVRLSKFLGLESYESFREIFREDIRQRPTTYPDRARWLQSLSDRDEIGALFASSARASLQNIEHFFTTSDYRQIQEAARMIVQARTSFVVGVGVNHAVVQNFAYLANMAIDGVIALPDGGTLPVDGLTRAGPDDVLIAISFHPYRREVAEAVAVAAQKGVSIISISDRASSPILFNADVKFLVSTETPQFFVSTLALTAFFEVLVGFIIAEAGEDVVKSINDYHLQRRELEIYVEADEGQHLLPLKNRKSIQIK